jgi:DNA-binding NarL/FixJ family response regulator
MRLILADDSLLIREGLIRLLSTLGHELAATAGRIERLPALVAQHQPDVIVIDIKMPPTYTDEGLRAAAALRASYPTLGILILSQYVVLDYATSLLEAGPAGVGYLLKDRLLDASSFDDALHRIRDGGTVVDPALVTELLRTRGQNDPLAALTARERDVLRLMAEGLSDRGIAAELYLSTNTVGTHVQHLFRKLNLSDSPTDNKRVLAVLTFLVGRQRGP